MYCYNLNTKYISSLDNNIIVIEEISARLCTREREKLIELTLIFTPDHTFLGWLNNDLTLKCPTQRMKEA